MASLLKLEQALKEETPRIIGAKEVIKNRGLAEVAKMEKRIRNTH